MEAGGGRFLNAADAWTLREHGFVVKQLLMPHDIDSLRRTFDGLERLQSAPFHVTLSGRSLRENLEISNEIASLIQPRLEAIISGYAVVGSTFIVKSQGEKGSIPLHQDWASIDERRGCSLNVWCPLVDVDAGNGALVVIPGSHRWFQCHRSPQIPSVQLEFSPAIGQIASTIEVKAGHAVIYDLRLFHGSHSNDSPLDRVVTQTGLAPASEQLVWCHKKSEHEVDLRSATTEDFFNGMEYASQPSRMPTGKLIETVATTPLSEADVLARIEREVARFGSPPPPTRLHHRIKAAVRAFGQSPSQPQHEMVD